MNKDLWLVQVTIQDHCRWRQETVRADTVECQVFGILYKETKTKIWVCPWVSENTINSDDSDSYVIEKSPSCRLKKIKRIKGIQLS